MFKDRDVSIGQVQQTLVGGGVTTSVGSFESFDDVAVFVRQHFPGTPVYECFWDIMVALGSLTTTVTDFLDVQDSEVHASKVG